MGSRLPPLPDDRHVTLSSGRRLAYVEVGEPDGVPVVSNHGGLSSRLDVVPAHRAAGRLGLRIISPDRPGIGRSDPAEGRTMAGWSDDVAELADRLGIGRFALLGWSLGGCFAQAVAVGAVDRVPALALVASGIPADWPGMHAEINRLDRSFLRMAESAPGRLVQQGALYAMHAAARVAPRVFARAAGFRGADSPVFAEAIAQGVSRPPGVVREYVLMNRPWGFDPSEISVDTSIWQGDADPLVPPAWATRLNQAIDSSRLTVLPGADHYLWYQHWEEILGQLADATRG